MEKLIKIQSLINEIEQLSGLKSEYQTTFDYKDEKNLIAKCYCTTHAINLYQITNRIENVVTSIYDSKLEYFEYI